MSVVLAVSQAEAGAGDATLTASRLASGPSEVRISDGVLQGAVHDEGRLFAGIPYAAPPVGALRWTMPRPETPWTGVRAATTRGQICAQTATPGIGGPSSTSEDCLTLNVNTPPVQPRSAHLPVMVWIHGGSFVSGAGSQYDPEVIARRGNVIVVTINYRLGAFGWLASPALDAESRGGASGDYGLGDQQAALRWVQSNIASFGGNPHNVTIFGESAGGSSVCAQLASPSAAGLFQRAIAESGCSIGAVAQPKAAAAGSALAQKLGCTDTATQLACLRGRSAADVLAASSASMPTLATGTRILPTDVETAFQSGKYHRVPLINGTNHDEGTLLLLLALGTFRPTEPQYEGLVAQQYGASSQKVLAAYPASKYSSPTLALAAVVTDSDFTCPALRADAALSRSTLVYGYEFNDPSPPVLLQSDFPLGAYHGSELAYVFQRTPVQGGAPRFTPAQLALSNQIIDYWTHFARYGVPDTTGQPRWPAAVSRQVQSLDPAGTRPVSISSVVNDHHCSLWDSLPPTS
ncbi:carboxylesterase family protein [Frankia sp. AgB1.9]|uniref:carboxylesterase/lipase family protein n=1 Tax=unclassified Frankia TaxID=2632575 RepID=UPI001931CB69|nr:MULTISPECIES: carboxylesterase family protein [unclassified Frankia]MBL7489960.1 carboxylesterase family protein [Frankia sp. AgW1.1]MBL7552152.1 carboxylesterase family protein [Frankia sp. AgB1.9]MBL7625251.1 carboxylesterase family protein [Frankia sp. AgB1.8]